MKELRDSGTSILFSTHRMEHVEELCRNITILHRSNTVLKGSLKEIKGQFQKRKFLLNTDKEISGLDKIVGVNSVTRLEHGYEIGIQKEEVGDDILRLAISQSRVSKFEIKEPTLNEIFIKMVGDKHE